MIISAENYPVVYGSINLDTLRIQSILSVCSKSHSDYATSTLQGMLDEEHKTWRYVPFSRIVWYWGVSSSDEIQTTIRKHVKLKYQGDLDQFINIERAVDYYKNKLGNIY